MSTPLFDWIILQPGQLPLRPNRFIDPHAEHRCTSVLVWPEGTAPTPHNTVLVDPCFSPAGHTHAATQLATLNVTFAAVGRLFVTHLHGDHMPNLSPDELPSTCRVLRACDLAAYPGLAVVHCPGHDTMLEALVIPVAGNRKVWVVGDAVLDEEWLRAWGYYWPNGYGAPEVIETWRSVARIIAGADMIVPGHGPAFEVTADLIRDLLDAFPRAPSAGQCPEATEMLRLRLAALSSQEPKP